MLLGHWLATYIHFAAVTCPDPDDAMSCFLSCFPPITVTHSHVLPQTRHAGNSVVLNGRLL